MDKMLEQFKKYFLMHVHPPDTFQISLEAIIKFTPKKDKDLKNLINYRPISLLEVPGEIIER